jgi:hypothetical protein
VTASMVAAASTSPPTSNVRRCYNCQSTAHSARECPTPPTCSNCGRKGHSKDRCWAPATTTTTAGQRSSSEPLTCSHCKRPGHTSERCYYLHGFPADKRSRQRSRSPAAQRSLPGPPSSSHLALANNVSPSMEARLTRETTPFSLQN